MATKKKKTLVSKPVKAKKHPTPKKSVKKAPPPKKAPVKAAPKAPVKKVVEKKAPPKPVEKRIASPITRGNTPFQKMLTAEGWKRLMMGAKK